MSPGETYRVKATELRAMAERERNERIRAELELLALSYLRLAEQADRNSHADITYQTPPERTPVQQQQAQQIQPKAKDDD